MRKDTLDRVAEVAGPHLLPVRVTDASTNLERVRLPVGCGRRYPRREIGDKRSSFRPGHPSECNEAVVDVDYQRPRIWGERPGGVKRAVVLCE